MMMIRMMTIMMMTILMVTVLKMIMRTMTIMTARKDCYDSVGLWVVTYMIALGSKCTAEATNRCIPLNPAQRIKTS